MNTPAILAATAPVVEAFEQLGVPYHIGGSVASSLNGIPRSTIDVDLIADLRLGQVQPLVKQLEATYYIDEDMIRDAIMHRSSLSYLPGKNASKLLAAGLASNKITCAAKVITISAAVVN